MVKGEGEKRALQNRTDATPLQRKVVVVKRSYVATNQTKSGPKYHNKDISSTGTVQTRHVVKLNLSYSK